MAVQYTGLVGTGKIVFDRFRSQQKKRGFMAACGLILSLVGKVLLTPYYGLTRGRRFFTVRGEQFQYFCHWYNTTACNERAVEISYILSRIKGLQPAQVLEVGNVLSHYMDARHDILDKYEQGAKVINEDAADFHPAKRYTVIASISTIEHIGFDEVPPDPEKIPRALENLRNCLADGGTLIATVPVAYNPNMDRLIAERNLFDEYVYLRRVSSQNQWEECSKEEALACRYNDPWMFGNALVIGIIRK